MSRIYNSELINKCRKVKQSCKTKEQYYAADTYLLLAMSYMHKIKDIYSQRELLNILYER